MHSNKLVRESKEINKVGCKIKVPSPWNVQLGYQVGYQDIEVVDFIEFGWPLDVVDSPVQGEFPRNQKGAMDNVEALECYVKAEKQRGGIIGPFLTNPLGKNAKFSPLDAIPKRDSDDLRIIMNLSYPHNQSSVNASMSKDNYLGQQTSLRYPSIEDLVRIIKKKERGCLLFKCDLWKCYRQIYMDPGFIHVLGFTVGGKLYFDVVLTMGLRIACYIYQRITNAVMYIYRCLSYEGINYLDDLGEAESRNKASEAFLALGKLLRNLEIWEAEAKATPPSEIMTFLGVSCNSVTFTLEITTDRLREILALVRDWLVKDRVSLQEVQSLAGKLNFVCSTVRSGRVLLARILSFLCEFQGRPGRRKLTEDIKQDLRWWDRFLYKFDGVSMFPESRWLPPNSLISMDSCLTGCGGWSDGEYFHAEFPSKFNNRKDININELECLAVVVAVKVWLPKLQNKNVLMYCDNEVTVQVINRGNARNKFTQACLRELVWFTANNNTWVKMCYCPGISNRICYVLSCWTVHDKYVEQFLLETEGCRTKEIMITADLFEFQHDW